MLWSSGKNENWNWWLYILLGLSGAIGIYLEQQLGQAFLLFSRNTETFLENSSLTRAKEAAPPVLLLTCKGWLFTVLYRCTRMGSRSTNSAGPSPTKKHMATNTVSSADLKWAHCCGQCTCRDILLPSPPRRHIPAQGRRPAHLILQWVSVNLCLGPYVLAGTWLHESRHNHKTLLSYLNGYGTLSDAFSAQKIDSYLPYPAASFKQLRLTQQTPYTSYANNITTVD